MIAFFVFITIIGLLLALVVYGTFAKNRWGINLDPVLCPRCNKALATIRRPNSLGQVLWGGSTCKVCGTEVDKWDGHYPC